MTAVKMHMNSEELRRLRRENKQLRIEREILSQSSGLVRSGTDAIQRKSSLLRESAPRPFGLSPRNAEVLGVSLSG